MWQNIGKRNIVDVGPRGMPEKAHAFIGNAFNPH